MPPSTAHSRMTPSSPMLVLLGGKRAGGYAFGSSAKSPEICGTTRNARSSAPAVGRVFDSPLARPARDNAGRVCLTDALAGLPSSAPVAPEQRGGGFFVAPSPVALCEKDGGGFSAAYWLTPGCHCFDFPRQAGVPTPAAGWSRRFCPALTSSGAGFYPRLPGPGESLVPGPGGEGMRESND